MFVHAEICQSQAQPNKEYSSKSVCISQGIFKTYKLSLPSLLSPWFIQDFISNILTVMFLQVILMMVVHLCRKVIYGLDVSYRVCIYVLGTLMISVVSDYKTPTANRYYKILYCILVFDVLVYLMDITLYYIQELLCLLR